MQAINVAILDAVSQYTKQLFEQKDKPFEDWQSFSATFWGSSLSSTKLSTSSLDEASRKTQRSSDQAVLEAPKPKQAKVLEAKTGKCVYKFSDKSKTTPNKICDKPCAGKYCAQHRSTAQAKNDPENNATSDEASEEKKRDKPVSKPLKSKTPTKETITDYLIKSRVDTIQFTLNKYGNYEHLDTGLIRDPNTNKVVGKQDEQDIKELTVNDIELCKQLGLNFVLPHTLGEVAEKPKEASIEDNTEDYDYEGEDDDEEDQ